MVQTKSTDFITNIPDLFDKQTQNLKQEEKYEEQTKKVVDSGLLLLNPNLIECYNISF